jgi:chorismate mutase
MEVTCTSIEDVRQHIDQIDRDVVALLAKRGKLVNQAAAFKKTTDDVRAPTGWNRSLPRCGGWQKRPEPRPRWWSRSIGR